MNWKVVCLLAALSACRGPAVTDDDVTRTGLSWIDAPGGSLFGKSSVDMPGFRSVQAYRCWPADAGYECISVFRVVVEAGLRDTISLARSDNPRKVEPYTYGAYHCEASDLFSGVTEKINRASATLVQNTMTDIGNREPWSKGYVVNFQRENGLTPPVYFDCPKIAALIRSGSIETLSTTAVDKP